MLTGFAVTSLTPTMMQCSQWRTCASSKSRRDYTSNHHHGITFSEMRDLLDVLRCKIDEFDRGDLWEIHWTFLLRSGTVIFQHVGKMSFYVTKLLSFITKCVCFRLLNGFALDSITSTEAAREYCHCIVIIIAIAIVIAIVTIIAIIPTRTYLPTVAKNLIKEWLMAQIDPFFFLIYY